MKNFLLRMKVNGIKSIDKEIQIDFYKASLSKKFDAQDSHVKAIYGTNGAGKTSIIYAVDLYKKLVLDSEHLALCNKTGSIKDLINQKSETFMIEMFFACIGIDGGLNSIYRHKIVLNKVNNRYVIAEENLSKLTGLRINCDDKYRTIFHVKNGEIVDIEPQAFKEEIIKATMNLLDKQTVSAIMLNYATNKELKTNKDFIMNILYCIMFAANITVVLQDTDSNCIDFPSFANLLGTITEEKNKFDDQDLFNNLLVQNQILKRATRQIAKKNIEKFEKEIYNLERFIKVFKDDLESILIEKDDNGDIYECEIVLLYKDGKKISEKYESSGIKKIVNLYSSLCNIEKGQVVFIDEFDANIHDVLLIRLLEYIVNYSKGQLIFTTHNLAPMEVLKNAKHSIDFLSPDSRIASWTKSGNYTPDTVYRKGLIEYSPFNLEAFNFIGVFGDEK